MPETLNEKEVADVDYIIDTVNDKLERVLDGIGGFVGFIKMCVDNLDEREKDWAIANLMLIIKVVRNPLDDDDQIQIDDIEGHQFIVIPDDRVVPDMTDHIRQEDENETNNA